MKPRLTQYKQGERTYWCCQYRENGKPKREYFGNVRTTSKGLATERFQAWLKGDTSESDQSHVVGEVCDIYLDFVKAHRSEVNWKTKRRHLQFLKDHVVRGPYDGRGQPLATLFADLFTEDHFREFLAARSKVTTIGEVDQSIKAIRACWNWLANPFHISRRSDAGGGVFKSDHRPLQYVKRIPSAGGPDVRKEILTDEDVRLLDTAASKLTRDVDFRNYLRFCLLTGCRPGEAAAARREDYADSAIILAKHKTDWVSPNPRVIRLSGLVKEMVEAKPPGLLFGCESVPYLSSLFRLIRHNTDHTLYCTRHTYITKRILKGEPIALIAKHCSTSIEQIQRTYFTATQQAIQEQADRAAADMDSMFG